MTEHIYDDLRGKRLLVLGATPSEQQIVEAAKEMGVYAICTDNHTDWATGGICVIFSPGGQCS